MASIGLPARYVVVAVGAFTLFLLALHASITQTGLSFRTSALRTPTEPSKNAFCVFLAEPNEAIKDKDEDYYFVGTRMLIYQLLHDPETKTNTSIPFVVLVTTNVPKWKRDQLTRDGATVQEVEEIKFDWIKPGRVRWAHVMDKLHVFKLTQFEKVLLLDTDMVVTKRLDGVFEDPAAAVQTNAQNPTNVMADEAPQPAQFVMAGNGGPGEHKGYTRERNGKLNAGFVVFKPSIEMFDYYMSVASIEGRFPGGSPEQDLWNYAHRKAGNMPWLQLDPDWTINSPNYDDYVHGVATFHEKYWRCPDRGLRDVLLRSRWKMEGFLNAYSWEENQSSHVSAT